MELSVGTSPSLAVKHRPQVFDDLVGDQLNFRILRAAIEQGVFRNAYLFSGAHGNGKTTTARIFARAACCEDPVQGNPCNQCWSCKLSLSGMHPDIIERDTADEGGVEGIRSLIDQCNYSTLSGSKRVFILDEAHMLTPSAANALLKTLEEPPEGTMFVLCTTEPHRLLPTIASRCLPFHFGKVSPADIFNRLKVISIAESLSFSDSLLRMIASSVSGTVRDAIVLLDKLALLPNVGVETVRRMTGKLGEAECLDVLYAIADNNQERILAWVDERLNQGFDAQKIIAALNRVFYMMLTSKLGKQNRSVPESLARGIGETAAAYSKGQILNVLDVFSGALRDIRNGGDAEVLFCLVIAYLTDLSQKLPLKAEATTDYLTLEDSSIAPMIGLLRSKFRGKVYRLGETPEGAEK